MLVHNVHDGDLRSLRGRVRNVPFVIARSATTLLRHWLPCQFPPLVQSGWQHHTGRVLKSSFLLCPCFCLTRCKQYCLRALRRGVYVEPVPRALLAGDVYYPCSERYIGVTTPLVVCSMACVVRALLSAPLLLPAKGNHSSKLFKPYVYIAYTRCFIVIAYSAACKLQDNSVLSIKTRSPPLDFKLQKCSLERLYI